MGHQTISNPLLRQIVLFFACLCLIQSVFAQDRAAGRVQLEYVDQDSGQKVSQQLYAHSYALLIGVSDYTNGWPDLPGVVKDIDLVRSTLEAHGFEVTTVMNPKANELEDAYTDFIGDYGWQENARLLFYYAGHGHTRETSYGKKVGYIIPVDAPLYHQDEPGFRKTALNLAQLETMARNDIDSPHALFLFDSCFSGSILSARAATGLPPHISNKVAKPTRQFLTSGSAQETVPDDSVFCRQFCEALSGVGDVNKDGYVTAMELYGYLHEKVLYYTNSTQTPQFGVIRDDRLDKGDFVFTIGPTPTPTVTPRPTTSTHPSTPSTGSTKPPQKTTDPFQAKHDAAYNEAKSADNSSYTTIQQKIDAWEAFLSDWGVSPKKNEILARIEELKQGLVTTTSRLTPDHKVDVRPNNLNNGKTKTIDLGGGVTMDLVYIKPGTFKMGSEDGYPGEKPLTTVTLTQGFWMGKTEVTQAQWRAVMGSDPQYLNFKGNDNNPVERVSWYDCMDFCKKLSSQSGFEVTLPTEAQWEYACRAGTTTHYSFGDLDSHLGNYAWYKENSGNKTHPVATNKPNPWGLYDMHGNVGEFCLDWYGDYPGGSFADYKGSPSGSLRVYRGGGWISAPGRCRSAFRFSTLPDARSGGQGLRVVSSSPPN